MLLNIDMTRLLIFQMRNCFFTNILQHLTITNCYINFQAKHTIYWIYINLNCIIDCHIYKIAYSYFVLQNVMFYDFSKHSLWQSIIHNNQSNKFSFDITRKFSYTNKGEINEL